LLSLAATACQNSENSATTPPTATPLTATTQTATATPPRPTAPENSFKLGYILPQTGSLALIAQGVIKGVELAAAEINQVGIQTVQLLPGDSGTDPDIANNTLDQHVSDGVHGIVGAAGSAISLAIIDKVKGSQFPMVSPTNAAPTFTNYDDGGYYFRTFPTDLLQGQILGDLIASDGGIDVAILFRADEFGRALEDIVRKQLEANGASVVVSLDYDPSGTTFQAEVQKVAASGADSVLLIPFDEGSKIIVQMIEAGIGPQDVNIYIPSSFVTESLWESVDPTNPSAVAGIRGTRPAPGENAEETFSDRFNAFAPGVDEVFAPNGYDAVVILLLAALVAGSNDPADYVGKINDVTRVGIKCNRYEVCAQLVLSGEDIDYDGASGPLDFTDVGEPSEGYFDIIEYDAQGRLNVEGYVSASVGQ